MNVTPPDEDTTPEQLQEMIRDQKEASAKLQQQVETMRLRNELEAQQLQQAEWELAIQQLKDKREQMNQHHEDNLAKMRTMVQETTKNSDQAMIWMEAQLSKKAGPPPEDSEAQAERQAQLEQLHRQQEEMHKQQEDLQKKIAELSSDKACGLTHTLEPHGGRKEQDLLLEQLRMALAPKGEEKDPNRAMLKALFTSQNKALGMSGTNTLNPDMMRKISGDGDFSMSEWLASLNRQEEGESDLNKFFKQEDDYDCRGEWQHSKLRSGMLDKSTTNIRRKEVWPQKNLGEDWAEEELEFKQLRFEHLVAGETRTIETCSEPADIMGRLCLLRRISYLKLRGIEWPLLRRMYAAILSSIETRE